MDGFADIHGDGGRRAALLSCAYQKWLDVGDVAWVIRVMRHQYLKARIRPLSNSGVGNTSGEHNVWWGIRDSAWVCRAKCNDRAYVKTLCVTRRAKRERSQYEDTKNMPMLPFASGNGVPRPVVPLEQA